MRQLRYYTPTNTSVLTATFTLMPCPTPEGPVKIGVIYALSGSTSMSGLALAYPIIKLVEQQVKDQGGISATREEKPVKANRNQPSQLASL